MHTAKNKDLKVRYNMIYRLLRLNVQFSYNLRCKCRVGENRAG